MRRIQQEKRGVYEKKTNPVSAHTGMATSRMFTDLEQLEVGDLFSIHVLDETLTYEVDQILVVKPYQIEALAIDAEQDYVTLVTCTPYGVNSHRLLVRGRRVETASNSFPNTSDVTAVEDTPRQSTWMVKYWAGILQGLAMGLAVALTLCLWRFARKHRKRDRYEA